ncbi:MAG: hypothetical protein E3J21_06735 [Anaerolineales bacterium]|nr:MAG: hypothetical protein E3J21_06735 [Anaerolineales bacterium]
MSFLHALDSARRPMQRLGFAKYVISRCASTSTSSLETLGRGLVETVRRKLTVPLTPEIYAYARRRLTDRAYAPLKQELNRLGPDFDAGHTVRLEIQDVYLASSQLPSQTGKLVAGDWRKYPPLLLALGLIRPGTYSLMVAGLTLLRLTPDTEVAAFREYTPQANPLLLDTRQRLFFLYCLLERDGDVLQPLYRALLERDAPFSDREAGDLLPAIFRDLEKRYRGRARSGDELQRLQRLLDEANSIERWQGRTYTGKGAREEHITPRLEPFADMGLLDKPDPSAYRYTLSPAGRALFTGFCEARDIAAFLENDFFHTADAAFGFDAAPADETQVLARLYAAYNELKSPLGYAPIKEAALLAGVRALVDERLRFEIAEAVELLKRTQRELPYVIRFNIDRMGNLVYVKFLADPRSENEEV